MALLITNATEIITCVPAPNNPAGRVSNATILIDGERIVAVAPEAELRARFDLSGSEVLDASGLVVAPGFVDSHTHVVFGGSRVKEYAAKLTRTGAEAKAYLQAQGLTTGILATVNMTRAASEEELTASASERLNLMLAHGTTTVESKTGYGLTLADELKMLAANARLQATTPLDIISSFLGAHDFPPEMERERYVDLIIHEMLPRVAEGGLAEFCDVYCDDGDYTLEQTRRILEAGRAHGLKLKAHVDQYSALGGSELCAELGVVSADHLNYTPPDAMRRLAEAGVVGVLMPMIDFAVKHPRPFDVQAMREAGMKLALATDICPGGWVESMFLVMQFACRQHSFSPEEAIVASTVGGAQACALNDRGQIAPGQLADLQLWAVPALEDVIYRLGHNPVKQVIKRGRPVLTLP
ncbi:MAG: imidazolonepropionase [Anaerolineales bacterium]|nr:imidazolonepropionase [Anaerolineales bacterium]